VVGAQSRYKTKLLKIQKISLHFYSSKSTCGVAKHTIFPLIE
jgi:hypothetical protein